MSTLQTNLIRRGSDGHLAGPMRVPRQKSSAAPMPEPVAPPTSSTDTAHPPAAAES
ncbi:hypothetical protein [Xanthomonas cucurbitae]|uniref:hypothetical protein n=1 Tax=Xanthomonas cucurbitae TaxID=56453 RepID=UPI00133140DD|nr:hypothetical protein [Xanthomonas cucurbitae]